MDVPPPRRRGRPRKYARTPLNLKVTDEQNADLRAIKQRTGRDLADLLREGVDHVRQLYSDEPGRLTAVDAMEVNA